MRYPSATGDGRPSKGVSSFSFSYVAVPTMPFVLRVLVVGLLSLLLLNVMAPLATVTMVAAQSSPTTTTTPTNSSSSSSTTTISSEIPSTVVIGVSAQFTYPNDAGVGAAYDPLNPLPVSSYYGFGIGPGEYAAFKFQIQQINARSDILPHTNISLVVYDDQFITERGFTGALSLIQSGARAIIGCSSSGPSGNAEFVARNYQVPLLSWAASSPSLANKRSYPWFSRVCQDDSTQAIAMAWFARYKFKWDQLAIISTNDLYGSFGSAAFVDAAKNLNITVLAEVSFPVNSVLSDVEGPLQRLKASGSRIFVYFGQPQDYKNVIQRGMQLGLYTNSTAWLVSDAVSSDSDVNSVYGSAMMGHIGVAPDGGTNLQSYTDFLDAFMARPVDPNPVENWSGARSDFSFYQAFAADAANFIAAALHTLIYTQGKNNSWTGSDLFDTLKQTKISSVSGEISLDANQDRIGLQFQLLNCQSAGSWKVMGLYHEDAFTPVAGAGDVIWADGTTIVPLASDPPLPPEAPTRALLSQRAYTIMIVLSSALLAVVCSLALVVLKFRKSRVIHAASWIMLMLVLFGGGLVSLSALLSAFPQEKGICTARVWLFNFGFTIAFGSLFLKTYRVHKIFNNKRLMVTAFNDLMLMQALGVGLCFDGAVLALRTGLAPYSLDEHGACVFGSGREDDASEALTIILVVAKAMVIAAAAYLAYAVRNLPQLYNESSYLAVAIYNTLMISAAWVGIRYGVNLNNQPDVRTLLDNGVMLICTFLTIMLVFAPKLVDLIKTHRKSMYQAQMRKKASLAKSSGGAAGSAYRSSNTGSTLGSPVNRGSVTAAPTNPGNEVDILGMLEKVNTEAQAAIERNLVAITRAEETIATKKSENETATEMLFQIGIELEYFAELKNAGTPYEELLALFEQKLAEFGAAAQAANAKAGTGGGLAGNVSSLKSSSGNLSAAGGPPSAAAARRQSAVYSSLAQMHAQHNANSASTPAGTATPTPTAPKLPTAVNPHALKNKESSNATSSNNIAKPSVNTKNGSPSPSPVPSPSSPASPSFVFSPSGALEVIEMSPIAPAVSNTAAPVEEVATPSPSPVVITLPASATAVSSSQPAFVSPEAAVAIAEKKGSAHNTPLTRPLSIVSEEIPLMLPVAAAPAVKNDETLPGLIDSEPSRSRSIAPADIEVDSPPVQIDNVGLELSPMSSSHLGVSSPLSPMLDRTPSGSSGSSSTPSVAQILARSLPVSDPMSPSSAGSETKRIRIHVRTTPK